MPLDASSPHALAFFMPLPCRLDHGLCLARLAKPAGARYAFVMFTDGSVYRIAPVSDDDVFAHTTRPDQPGCWFNALQHHDPRYTYEKQAEWPAIPPSGWLSVYYV